MNYRKIYMMIINNAKKQNRKKGKDYYENHHILPKSLFPLWIKRKSNFVLLTAREHFFVHQLLTKIYPSKEMDYAVIAFISRPNADYKINSKEYERLKKLKSKRVSEQMMGNKFNLGKTGWNKGMKYTEEQKQRLRGIKRSPQACKNISLAHIGVSNGPHSEETKRKISKANKGRKMSPETIEKYRQAQLGKVLSEETKRKISLSNREKKERKNKKSIIDYQKECF